MNSIEKTNIITAKPSKSYEQRLLAGALLSAGNCTIKNYGQSDDVIAARNIIKILGSNYTIEKDILKVSSGVIPVSEIIDCNESALCARLFASIACIFKNKFILTGQKSLLQRPVASDFDIFEQMGCKLEYSGSKLPVVFLEANLKSGKYIIDGSKTSQIISGLTMSLPAVNGDSQLIIKSPSSIDYIFLSMEIAGKFGIKYDHYFSESGLNINISGNQKYNPGNFTVEGDWSGISFILVAGVLCCDILVDGLNPESKQADKKILEVFDLAGVKYSWSDKILKIKRSDIKAFEFNAKDCPDLIPAITVLALFADGTSRIYGAKRLAGKESSRAEVLAGEFEKTGAKIKYIDDLLEIEGKRKYKKAKLDPHNDHRMAMAFAVAGLKTNGGIDIENPSCVSKSYPEFFNDLKKVKIQYR